MNAGILSARSFPGLLRAGVAVCLAMAFAGCEPLDLDFGGGGEVGGGNIAFIRNGNLLMSPPGGGDERYIVRDQGTPSSPAFAPNGQRIAFAYNEFGDESSLGIYIYNRANDSIEALVTPLPGTSYTSPSWSPDGTSIVFVETSLTGTRLLSISSEGGSPVEVPQAPLDLQFPAFVDANNLLVLRGAHNEIHELAWGSAQTTSLKVRTNSRPAVSADGSLLAYSVAEDGGRIVVRTLATGDEVRLAPSGRGDVKPTFSPPGDVVAFEAGGQILAIVLDDEDEEIHVLQSGTDVTWGP